MAVYRCRRCQFEQNEPWEGPCPHCGGFYRGREVRGASTDENGGLSTMGGGAKKYTSHHISTGLKGFDDVVGGGLIAGRVILLGGFPGSGKTRMLLLIADYIAKTQGRVIYASGEESEDDLQSYCAELQLRNDRVTLLGLQDTVEDVLKIADELKAFLVLYDSAQKFTSRTAGGSPGSLSQCKAIGSVIKNHCGRTKTCAVIVNQMSSTGDLKGGTELEHHCDIVLVFGFAKESDDEGVPEPTGDEPIRVLSSTKNRKGSGGVRTYWDMLAGDIPGTPTCVPAKSKLVVLPRSEKHKRDPWADEEI